MDQFSDHNLLLQLQAGDKVAFDLLYEKYWETTFDTAFKLSKDQSFAMDATQDIFLRIWERKEHIQIRDFSSYLRTSARNRFLTWIKNEKRETSISDFIMNESPSDATADHPLLVKELMKAYENVVSRFPKSQQGIFKMRYEQGMTTKEIASSLHISQKTVQNQIGRSLLTLKRALPTMFNVLILIILY